MPLPSLNLDDRRFDDLLAEAQRQIQSSCPEWTDHSPGDPGTVLLEAFAHLTEIMIYRLNRLPDKAYREFLRLLGLKLVPPAAASVMLRFSQKTPTSKSYEIPRGTRVSTARSDPDSEALTFVTATAATMPPDTNAIEVRAFQCELVEGELVGHGNGLPGLSVTVERAPIIARTGEGFELVVGIEVDDSELGSDTPARRVGDSSFRIWREVDNFSAKGPDDFVYVVDRMAGQIHFAPALRSSTEEGLADRPTALAAIPGTDRAIRIWYATGGGSDGNVAAGLLTVMKDPLPGTHLDVTNPKAATGGKAAESLDNALLRGPLELHSLRRAVTARDFELVAVKSSGAINRAYPYTKAAKWRHAVAGTVEVVLVPELPAAPADDAPVTAAMLREQETEDACRHVQESLDQRRPLGTTCLSSWARYKSVQVKARVVVHREEDPGAVKARVLQRLYNTINPLQRNNDQPGWPFGQPLSAYHVYKILGEEPGVKNVEPVQLLVEEVPGADVDAIEADAYQPGTWYAGALDTVFRTLNNGDGWEPIGRFHNEQIELVKAFPREAGIGSEHAGLLAIATRSTGDDAGARVHISRDCGESWQAGPRAAFRIHDMTWMEREGVATLLLATDVGFYEVTGKSTSLPVQILVEPSDQKLGFYAVAVSTDMFGRTSIALAARERKGVYLSTKDGKPGTFTCIGLKDEMVRILQVHQQGPNRNLWAGLQAVGNDPGKGCYRWELSGASQTAADWRHFGQNWRAGGCEALAFLGSNVLAATSRAGIVSLNTEVTQPAWEPPDVDCGLPLRSFGDSSRQEFVMERIQYLAAEPNGREPPPDNAPDVTRAAPIVLAATHKGVFKSTDRGQTYTESSRKVFTDAVTLPATWLLCSAEHDIEVLPDDGS